MTEPGCIALAISAVTRIGAFWPGNRGRGDHHVLLAQHFGEQFALPAVKLLVHGFGVSALVFGGGAFDIQNDEFRAEAFDLLLHRGAHVVSGDHRAQTPRHRDGLQARDARPEDENLAPR